MALGTRPPGRTLNRAAGGYRVLPEAGQMLFRPVQHEPGPPLQRLVTFVLLPISCPEPRKITERVDQRQVRIEPNPVPDAAAVFDRPYPLSEMFFDLRECRPIVAVVVLLTERQPQPPGSSGSDTSSFCNRPLLRSLYSTTRRICCHRTEPYNSKPLPSRFVDAGHSRHLGAVWCVRSRASDAAHPAFGSVGVSFWSRLHG